MEADSEAPRGFGKRGKPDTVSPTPRHRSLLALTVMALLAILPACPCDVRRSSDRPSVTPPVTSSTGFGVMAMGGPEVWNIDGRSFHIRATYFVIVNGRLQFTADYICGKRCPNVVGMSDDQAFAVAYPIMKHAVTTSVYTRTKVQVGGKSLNTELIGVAITRQTESGKESGYRVARTVEQVRAAIQAGGPGAQDAGP